jgi:hypothetical protein
MNRLSLFFKENMEIGVPAYLQMHDMRLDENDHAFQGKMD